MRGKKTIHKDLITKFLSGNATEEEKISLQKWLEENAENKKYFEETEFLWEATGIYRKPDEQNRLEDWKNIRNKIQAGIEKHPGTSGRRPRYAKERKLYGFLKIAGLFILAFGLSWVVYHFAGLHGERHVTYNEIITKKGQKTQMILSDGTHIWLNAESRLKYPTTFNKKIRKVSLSGEAYFKVSKTKNHLPFLVETPEMDIRVTGTIFNIKAYPNEDIVETTLIDGSITILRNNSKYKKCKPVVLKPNQKATLIKQGSHITVADIKTDKPTIGITENAVKTAPSKNEKIIVSPDVAIEPHVAWKNDRLIFNSETFEDITYQLERWFDVTIDIRNKNLKNYRYTGKFVHKESLDQILRVISLTTPFQYKIDKNHVIINKSVKTKKQN